MNKSLAKLKDRQNEVFTSMANILGGISSPVRIRLIHFLSQGPLTVEVLAGKIDQTVANTSMHLRKMHQMKIVSVSVQGKNRLYSLHHGAFAFWEACQDFIQEVDPSLVMDPSISYDEMDWNEDLKETIRMVKKGELILVDARPHDEVTDPLDKLNVMNIPGHEIGQNLSKFPKKKPVLVFCRGRMCALSAYAVNELRKSGVNAYRLNESWYALKKLI